MTNDLDTLAPSDALPETGLNAEGTLGLQPENWARPEVTQADEEPELETVEVSAAPIQGTSLEARRKSMAATANVGGTVVANTRVEPTPGVLETAGAFFQRESVIGSLATFGFNWGEDDQPALPGFNPYVHAEQAIKSGETTLEEIAAMGDRLDHVVNPTMFRETLVRHRAEVKVERVIEQGPWQGAALGMGLSLADPTTWVPAVKAAQGTRLAIRAARAAGVGAASAATQEAVLHGSQDRRTLQESFLSVGAAGLLTGVGGAFLHPKSPLQDSNPKNPLTHADAREADGISTGLPGDPVDAGEVVPPMRSVGAAGATLADAVDSQLAEADPVKKAMGWSREKLNSLAGVKGATPVSRALTWTGAKARQVTQGIVDLGGVLNRGMNRGMRQQASVEDLKKDIEENFKNEVVALVDNRKTMNQELAALGAKRNLGVFAPISSDQFHRIVYRKLTDLEHQNTGTGSAEIAAMVADTARQLRLDPAVAAPVIQKYTDQVAAEMHKANKALEERAIAAKLPGFNKPLGNNYGLPQKWRREWIIHNREEAVRLFTEIASGRPDADWLKANFTHEVLDEAGVAKIDPATGKPQVREMTLEDFDALPANSTRRANILDDWAGDEYMRAMGVAESRYTAAQKAFKDAGLELEMILNAVDLTKKETKHASHAARRAAARVAVMEDAQKRLTVAHAKAAQADVVAQQLHAKFGDAAGLAESAMAEQARLGDELVDATEALDVPVYELAKIRRLTIEGEQGAKEGALEAAKAELQAGSRRPVEVTFGPHGPEVTDGRHLLQAAIDLGIENLPVRYIGYSKAAKAAKQELIDARKAFNAVAKEMKQNQRWIDAAVDKAAEQAKALKNADGVEALMAVIKKQEPKLIALRQAMADAEFARVKAYQERLTMQQARNLSEKSLRAAAKDLKEATKAAQKLVNPREWAEDLVKSISDTHRFPNGILEQDIVEISGRLKERRIHLTPADRRRAEDLGALDTDLMSLRKSLYDDLGGRIALQERFGSVGLTKEMDEIVAEYDEMINGLQAAAKEDPKNAKRYLDKEASLKAEKKAAIEDVQGLIKRTISQPLSNMDPESFATWGARRMKQYNYIRFGMGFVLGALPDLSAMLLAHGPTKRMFPALKEAGKILNNSGIKRDHPYLAQLAESLELASQYVGHARQADADLTGYKRGIGSPGSGKHKATTGVDRVMDWAGQIASEWNPLFWWTRRLKAASGLTMVAQLADELPKYAKLSAAKKAQLASLGVDEKLAARLSAKFEEYGETFGSLFDPKADRWHITSKDGAELERELRMIVRRAQDRAVPTPGIGDTPLAMSSALGGLVMQFQSFGFKYTNTFLRPSAQRLLIHKDHEVVIAYMTAMILGTVTTAIRAYIRGEDLEDMSAEKWIYESLSRSGFFGYLSPYVDAGLKLGGFDSSRYAQANWWQTLLGPSFQLMGNVGQAASAAADGDAEKLRDKALQLAPARIFVQLYQRLQEMAQD